jgi:SPW repeat
MMKFATINEKLTARWKDAANFVLGIWLIVSPWVLGYGAETTAAWNAHVVGVVIAVAALAALIAFHEWEEWVNTALGV